MNVNWNDVLMFNYSQVQYVGKKVNKLKLSYIFSKVECRLPILYFLFIQTKLVTLCTYYYEHLRVLFNIRKKLQHLVFIISGTYIWNRLKETHAGIEKRE